MPKLEGSRSFLGSQTERVTLANLSEPNGASQVTRLGAVSGLSTSSRYSKLGLQFFQFPYLSRDVWHNLYRHINKMIVDYDRDKSTRFFELYPELNPKGLTDRKQQVKYLIGLISHYIYDSMNLTARFDIWYKWLQVRGVPMADRIAAQLKFSALNTKAASLKGLALNKEITEFISRSLPLCVKENGKYGTTLILPQLLPMLDTYYEAPQYKGASIFRPEYLNMHSNGKLFSLPEMSAHSLLYKYQTASPYTVTDYTEFPFTLGTPDYMSNSGYLVKKIESDFFTAVDHFKAKYGDTLMRPGNDIREFFVEQGILNTTFDVAELATMAANAPILDAEDYANKVFKYGSTLVPVHQTNNVVTSYGITNVPSSNDVVGNATRNPAGIPNWDELENTQWDLDTTQYVAANAHGDRSELPYAYIRATAEAALVDMNTNQDFSDPALTELELLGFNEGYGARDWTQAKASPEMDDGYHNHLSGFYHVWKNLTGFSQGAVLFTDGNEPLDAVNDPNVLLARPEFEEGIFRPYYHVSPMKNQMDPFQMGYFLVISEEETHTAGSHPTAAGTTWAQWFVDCFPVPSGIDIATETGDGSNNVWAEYRHLIKDAIVFLGDDVDSSPLLHFMRADISRSSWFATAAEFSVTFGTNAEMQDAGPMAIPAKPYTGIRDHAPFGGLISSVSTPIVGIEYDPAIRAPKMGITRKLFDGSITLSNPFWTAILGWLFGSSQPTTLGGFIDTLFNSRFPWGLSYVINNDFIRSADLRVILESCWLPLFAPSSSRLTPVTLRDGVFSLFTHVRPSTPQELTALPSILSSALPAPSIAAGDVGDAVNMLLDIKFMQRRARLKEDKPKRGRSKKSSSRGDSYKSKGRGRKKKRGERYEAKYTRNKEVSLKPDSMLEVSGKESKDDDDSKDSKE